MNKPKKRFNLKLFLWRAGNAIRRWVIHFVTEILPLIGGGLLLIPLFILFSPLLFFFWLRDEIEAIREKYRQHCSVHKVRFRDEIFTIPSEIATASLTPEDEELERERKRLRQSKACRLHLEPDYQRVEKQHFPYANNPPTELLESGLHHRRYCIVCRIAKEVCEEKPWLSSVRSRIRQMEEAESDDGALAELEALERKLGLVPELPEPIRDVPEGRLETHRKDSE